MAYSLSLRNLEEMMAEHGLEVDHSSVHRWVIKLVPLFEKAFGQHKRAVGRNWRMDETYIKARGQWKYQYRAVDKAGDTVDFLFRARRDKAAAQRYSEKAIDQNGAPETVTVDRSGANLAALQAVNTERETPHQDPAVQISEQHCRAGSPGYQTYRQTDDGLQGFSMRAHHPLGYRGHAYDPQKDRCGRRKECGFLPHSSFIR